MNRPRKVAIIGGGAGAMAAAFELTATPERRAQNQVTVYTPGWRLGGKGASGRNPEHGDRIEEHGLHIFFGFYDNAMELMRRCYDELDRAPGAPLGTFAEAFTPCDEIVFMQETSSGWTRHPVVTPRNHLAPGDGIDAAEQFWSVALDMVRWLERRVVHAKLGATPASTFGKVVRAVEHLVPSRLRRWVTALETAAVDEVARLGFARLYRELEGTGAGRVGRLHHEAVVRALTVLRGAVMDFAELEHDLDDRPDLRFAATGVDLLATIVIGLLQDDLLELGFGSVEDEELRMWLQRHGASELTLRHSAVLQALYDLTFAYTDGDTDRPDLAASKALQALIRIAVTYKGSVMYKMNAGMGDTIFGPYHDVLAARGVDFQFFTAAQGLGLSSDRRTVETIELVTQVGLVDPTEGYRPLVPVQGLPCWPSEPLWDQLADGPAVKARLDALGTTFEQTMNPLGSPSHTLDRGTDFDDVVIAVPPVVQRRIAGSLAEANPRYRLMLDHSASVATQAFQIWTDRTAADMGWDVDQPNVAGSFTEPFDTYCDMSHLLDRETWPASADVKGIGYFCGPLAETVAEQGQKTADAAVKAASIDRLDTSGPLFPKAVTDGRFDWSVLAGHGTGTTPSAFDGQYWRANTSGSERYVTTPAGSLRYRLGAGESGFANVTLAGDWTRNGIDGGSAEAATLSGRQAARAIMGSGERFPGEDGVLDTDVGGRSGYVDYGGYQSFPGPYACSDTTLTGFFAKGDADKIRTFVDKVFTDVSLARMRFEPLSDHVMLTWGDVRSVHPIIPPWDGYGTLEEPQVALWLPVARIDERGAPVDFWFAIPYIWLDNPMSLVSGRETNGFPKTWGTPGFPDASSPNWTLDVFGLDFAAENRPGDHRLLEVNPTSTPQDADEEWHSVEDAVHGLAGIMRDRLEPGAELAHLGSSAVADLLAHSLPQIFLKQYRSAPIGATAAMQQIVTSAAKVTRIKGRPLLGTFRLEVTPLDSQPVGPELGLVSQDLTFGFQVDMDFIQEAGNVLFDPTDRSRRSPR